ncbi:MAG TPA: hypothetical protein VMY18_10080 [Acidobacteriota bacterium]|nr:hypothetical protein [Acidobacteriota bacterium]
MQSKGSSSGSGARTRGLMIFVSVGLAILGVVVLLIGWDSTESIEGTEQVESGTTEPAGFDSVAGRWLRPDGGYILELSRPSPGEKFKATYLNPRPIRVATTRVIREEKAIRVYVELLDVGYPGSYYDLVYDPAGDRLLGIYYQAKMDARFEVFFVRADAQ